jgi:hypothetical protein
MFDGQARGSHGSPLRVSPSTPVAGGEAVSVRDSSVSLTNVELIGGSGGSVLVGNCLTAARGGSALHVDAPLGLPTDVSVRGGFRRAGQAGFFHASCASDPGITPVIDDRLGVVTFSAGRSRNLAWPSHPYPNGAFEVQLAGSPHDAYAILVAAETTPATRLPGIDGLLFVPAASAFVAYSGRCDDRGFTRFTDTIVIASGPLHVSAQAVVLDISGGLWLSSPGTITFR